MSPPFRKSIAHEGLQRLYGLIGLPSARLGVKSGGLQAIDVGDRILGR